MDWLDWLAVGAAVLVLGSFAHSILKRFKR